MNRLATVRPIPRVGKINAVLEHLDDANPDEAQTLRDLIKNPAIGHTELADAITMIAREDNLGFSVSEESIRRYRRHRKANA